MVRPCKNRTRTGRQRFHHRRHRTTPAPNFVKTDEAAVYEFATELHEKQKVSENTYEWVTEQLGEDGVVELTVICGYYGIISMVLNTFEVPLPDGEALPLRE